MAEIEKILVVCGTCAARIRVNPNLAGRSAACPKCSSEIWIPTLRPIETKVSSDDQREFLEKEPLKNYETDQSEYRESENVNQTSVKPTSKFCMHCGECMSKEAKVCIKCGIRQKAPKIGELKFCHTCGERIPRIAELCGKCGVNQGFDFKDSIFYKQVVKYKQKFQSLKKRHKIAVVLITLFSFYCLLIYVDNRRIRQLRLDRLKYATKVLGEANDESYEQQQLQRTIEKALENSGR